MTNYFIEQKQYSMTDSITSKLSLFMLTIRKYMHTLPYITLLDEADDFSFISTNISKTKQC